jgi:diacylglycerol kinase
MSEPTPPSLPPQHKKNSWAKFITGFGYAFSGLRYVLRTQLNMRVHLTIAFLALLTGLILRISAIEFAILFLTIAIVLITEMLNTVLELCVDLASPQYHPLAKIAKDVSAGAVLLSAIFSVIIGLFIFVPHLWMLIGFIR